MVEFSSGKRINFDLK